MLSGMEGSLCWGQEVVPEVPSRVEDSKRPAQAWTLSPPDTRCHQPSEAWESTLRADLPRPVPGETASRPGHLRAADSENRKTLISKKFTELPSQDPTNLACHPPRHPGKGAEMSGWNTTYRFCPMFRPASPRLGQARGGQRGSGVPIPAASGIRGGWGVSPGLPWTTELLHPL